MEGKGICPHNRSRGKLLAKPLPGRVYEQALTIWTDQRIEAISI